MERRGQQATVLQRDPRLCVDGCVSTAALLPGVMRRQIGRALLG